MENDRRKLNWPHLKIYLSNGNPVQLITKFEMETKFATLFLNDRKSQTLSLQKCFQKDLKMLQNTSYLQDASKMFQNRFKNATDF